MKKILILFAALLGMATSQAQQSGGDCFEGLSRKIGFSQMIPPHGLEITYDKTVHVIFPAPVKYVDLGSTDLLAGKADGAENVIRVKAATKHFRQETNMSVITEDGNFYSFNVKYADEPLLLNVEMCDFIHDGETVNRPNNAMEIYLTELDNESPRLVRLIMKSVHQRDKRRIRHVGCKRFGVQFLLKGLYTHSDLLYFHTEVRNSSNVPFDVDFVTFKIGEAYRHAGAGGLSAARLQLCDPGGRQEIGMHGVRPAEIHHSRRQEAGGGDVREAGRAAPGLRTGERGPGACGNRQ